MTQIMNIRSPRFRWMLAWSFLVAVDGLLPKAARAETRMAVALTPEAVWDAINAAKDGDIVRLPAGTAVWMNGWNTRHWAEMKAITLQGAGIDKTIIRDETSTASGDEPFDIKGLEGKPFRITGITFDGTGLPHAGTWAGEIVISGNCKNFRVDHCKFLNMDRMMTISGDTYGLIDHCYFHALQKKGGLAQTIMCMGPGKIAFTRPLTLGTAEAVYFEDNEARFSPEVVEATGNNPWTVPYQGERSFRTMGEFGLCDGTNPIDGNQIPADQKGAGYPCFGQPGRATDADGDGVFEASPCYTWNNTLNGAKLNMILRRWNPKETELQGEHVEEGRDFFNEAPKPEYYRPYTYPHPLQGKP